MKVYKNCFVLKMRNVKLLINNELSLPVLSKYVIILIIGICGLFCKYEHEMEMNL